MYKYSQVSQARLSKAHPAIQEVFNVMIKFINLGITCSLRTIEEQKELVKNKKSKTLNSKHIPLKDKGVGDEECSRAVDIVWYNDFEKKYSWNSNIYRVIGPAIIQLAKDRGYIFRWGGDWDQDGDQTDQKFMDLVHIEYIGKI